MAQTTTGVSECNVVISLDRADGTLTDISGSTNAVQITFSNTSGIYRRAGSTAPTRFLLEEDMTVTMTVVYSTATNEGLDVLRTWATGGITGDDARTLRVDVPDDNVGSDRYQAEVVVASLDVPLNATGAGPIAVNASLESTGAYSVSEIS